MSYKPKPSNYYLSKPQMFQETEEIRVPVVVITPKARWDSQKAYDSLSLDYRYLASVVNNIFGLDKLVAEVVENVYEPKDIKMNPDDFFKKLEEIGFEYNPELDAALTETIKELEELSI